MCFSPFLLSQQQRRRLIGLSNKRLNCCENRPQASTTCDQQINFRILVPPLMSPSRCSKAEAPGKKSTQTFGRHNVSEFHVMHKESVKLKLWYSSDETTPGGYSQRPHKHHRKGLLLPPPVCGQVVFNSPSVVGVGVGKAVDWLPTSRATKRMKRPIDLGAILRPSWRKLVPGCPRVSAPIQPEEKC